MRPSVSRACAVAVVVVGLLVSCFTREASAADDDEGAVMPASSEQRGAPACIPASKCCKICNAGKACGNSCISASKSCHKGRGCSCDAGEVCE
jgi:hypothetical protein